MEEEEEGGGRRNNGGTKEESPWKRAFARAFQRNGTERNGTIYKRFANVCTRVECMHVCTLFDGSQMRTRSLTDMREMVTTKRVVGTLSILDDT